VTEEVTEEVVAEVEAEAVGCPPRHRASRPVVARPVVARLDPLRAAPVRRTVGRSSCASIGGDSFKHEWRGCDWVTHVDELS
jgi:hypothetical protein